VLIEVRFQVSHGGLHHCARDGPAGRKSAFRAAVYRQAVTDGDSEIFDPSAVDEAPRLMILKQVSDRAELPPCKLDRRICGGNEAAEPILMPYSSQPTFG
jgi:hypothetical protein